MAARRNRDGQALSLFADMLREAQHKAAARLARQEIITADEPPLMYALVDEAVLHRPIGGPEVMHGQVAHLADLAAWPKSAFR